MRCRDQEIVATAPHSMSASPMLASSHSIFITILSDILMESHIDVAIGELYLGMVARSMQ